MKKYRITKYDPKKRDAVGRYLDNSEWISFYDVEKNGHETLTFLEYKKVESKYGEAIKMILKEKKVEKLKIDSLEKYTLTDSFDDLENNISHMEEGLELNLKEVENLIRLILREQVWMNLVSTKVEINFGYDYYMSVKCEEINPIVIQEIEESGLFIEEE